MAKYEHGQTSDEVIKIKNEITDSLQKKADLIKDINSYDDIHPSLEMKTATISAGAVYRWEDKVLGLKRCSYNTANKDHNKGALTSLLSAINQANLRLTTSDTDNNNLPSQPKTRLSQDAVDKLKEENEELRSALAEVYRAYIQALEYMREDCEVDDALRRLLLNQAAVLGKERVWEVK
ncbi:MAG: hypothetical protein JKY26_01835 [Pseudomonas sp.]|nr:hypothetical protein [Pseudomonas sp.]